MVIEKKSSDMLFLRFAMQVNELVSMADYHTQFTESDDILTDILTMALCKGSIEKKGWFNNIVYSSETSLKRLIYSFKDKLLSRKVDLFISKYRVFSQKPV